MLSLYFMGSSEQSTDSVGAEHLLALRRSAMPGLPTCCRSSICRCVKSRSDSLGKVTPGGVLVIAEPLPGAKNEDIMRTPAQGRHHSAHPAQMVRPAEREQARLDQRGDRLSTRSRRRLGAAPGRAESRACRRQVRRIGRRMRSISRPISKLRSASCTAIACSRSSAAQTACCSARSATATARSGCCRIPTSSPITAWRRAAMPALALAIIDRLRSGCGQHRLRRDHSRLHRPAGKIRC